jgi:hypothetical protein
MSPNSDFVHLTVGNYQSLLTVARRKFPAIRTTSEVSKRQQNVVGNPQPFSVTVPPKSRNPIPEKDLQQASYLHQPCGPLIALLNSNRPHHPT